jgi:hypothetical protein
MKINFHNKPRIVTHSIGDKKEKISLDKVMTDSSSIINF